MDKVKRYDFCCNFLGKLADDDKIMNRLVFSDEATFHLSDLTQMDFFSWGFVKGSVYLPPPPHCRQHYTSSRHGSERPVQIFIRKFSTTCGRKLNIGLKLLSHSWRSY
jgi:hypothetical protein